MWVLSLFLLVALVLVFSAWRAEVKRSDQLAQEKFDLVRELTTRIVFKPEPEIPFNPPDPLGQAVDAIFVKEELERLLNPPPDD